MQASDWIREKESCPECGLWSELSRDWLACPRCGWGTVITNAFDERNTR